MFEILLLSKLCRSKLYRAHELAAGACTDYITAGKPLVNSRRKKNMVNKVTRDMDKAYVDQLTKKKRTERKADRTCSRSVTKLCLNPS